MNRHIPLLTVAFLLTLSAASADLMTEFDFTVARNDSVDLVKILTYLGNPETAAPRGSAYTLLLTDSDNTTERLLLPVVLYVLHPLEEVDAAPASVRTRFNPVWASLELFHGNRSIFNFSLSGLFCNRDGSCSGYESSLTCPADCPSGSADRWCDARSDLVCDPDCLSRDPDCTHAAPQTLVPLIRDLPAACNSDGICGLYENTANCPADCSRPITTERILLFVERPPPSPRERALQYPLTERSIVGIVMALSALLVALLFLLHLRRR